MALVSRVEDFVKAGQAAQAAVDKLTRPTPSVAGLATDAAEIGSRLGAVIRFLDDAAAHRAHRRHTNAATLEQLARAELRKLAGAIDVLLRRFTVEPPPLVIYRCTCGYEYRNAEPPMSIKCRDCGGVAVNFKS